jgi:rhodanese-related sulfurtransferase
MSRDIREIDAGILKAWLKDGDEIALLDSREELTFGRRHLLMASCLPLSRIELRVGDLVPRRSVRVVWCDDGEGLAKRAAQRMAALGYTDVSVLEGGLPPGKLRVTASTAAFTYPARPSRKLSSTKRGRPM